MGLGDVYKRQTHISGRVYQQANFNVCAFVPGCVPCVCIGVCLSMQITIHLLVLLVDPVKMNISVPSTFCTINMSNNTSRCICLCLPYSHLCKGFYRAVDDVLSVFLSLHMQLFH